jgi:hypothetical protein
MWGYVKVDLKEMVYEGWDEEWDIWGAVCEPHNEPSAWKMYGISWLGQELLKFEKRICSMALVNVSTLSASHGRNTKSNKKAFGG